MPVPDAKARNKIVLTPSKVLSASYAVQCCSDACCSPCPISSRVPSRLWPKLIISNILYATALLAGKEWLLDYDVGVFWVVMRVLACGGVGVLVWEAFTGQLAQRKSIEVRYFFKTHCSVLDAQLLLSGRRWAWQHSSSSSNKLPSSPPCSGFHPSGTQNLPREPS